MLTYNFGLKVELRPESDAHDIAETIEHYLNFNGIDTEVPVEERVGFADADRMSSVEEDHAFQALYKANIFRGGTGDEQFRMYPTANTTRGNLAALLRRVSDYIREYRIERERNEAESQS